MTAQCVLTVRVIHLCVVFSRWSKLEVLEVATWRQSYPIKVVNLGDVGVVVVDVAVQWHKDN